METEVEYAERLRVPWSWWPVLVGIVVLGTLEAVGGLEFRWVVTVPVVVFLVGFFIVPLALSGRIQVKVQDGVFYAGQHEVSVRSLTMIQPLDRQATRAQLGPRADPAAVSVVRGWVPGSVMARMSNPDPVPYWIVSSRRPEELAAALKSAKAAERARQSR